MKTLSKGLFDRFNGKFTKENTIIIDDSPVKHFHNDFKNVLLLVSWLHYRARSSNTFLINTVLPYLQELHKSQDLRVAPRICHWIRQPMLCEDPFSIEDYVGIKEAIENVKKFFL